MLPTVPTSDRNTPQRPAIVLEADDFDVNDLDDIARAGTVFATVLSDLAFHEIGDAGLWTCYLDDPTEVDGPAEVERLRHALDRMQTAISAARHDLAAVERRTRRRAIRRTRRSGGAA